LIRRLMYLWNSSMNCSVFFSLDIKILPFWNISKTEGFYALFAACQGKRVFNLDKSPGCVSVAISKGTFPGSKKCYHNGRIDDQNPIGHFTRTVGLHTI
jgi:hypothetical protein